MIKIDKKLEHALIVLSHMSEHDKNRLYTAKELSKIYDIAFDSVSRVMQRMAKADFLISIQGPSGGYRISDKLKEKTLLDLLNAITKEKVKIAKCIGGKCDKLPICNIIVPVEKLNLALKNFYKSIELEELLNLKEVK